jgi:hypothetical protein
MIYTNMCRIEERTQQHKKFPLLPQQQKLHKLNANCSGLLQVSNFLWCREEPSITTAVGETCRFMCGGEANRETLVQNVISRSEHQELVPVLSFLVLVLISLSVISITVIQCGGPLKKAIITVINH